MFPQEGPTSVLPREARALLQSPSILLRRHGPALILLLGINWLHFRDLPDKLGETPYLSWLYILLVAGCAAAGAWLLSNLWRAGYVLGAVIWLGAR